MPDVFKDIKSRTHLTPPVYASQKDLVLNEAQQSALKKLQAAMTPDHASVAVLDGVTGSGKTEVYFELILDLLKNTDRQILVLLPEIALTAQWVTRFEQRFGALPTLWHSDVSKAQKRESWKQIISGESRLILGARSALFLPYPKLGLIIVDEEHEPSFKQEEGLIYHGRDMAVLRGHIEKIPVVLSSATPSLETIDNMDQGKYTHVELPYRYAGAQMPKVHLIDMNKNPLPKGSWLAGPLVSAMAENLEKGHQSLIFLNRRGYAPLTLCQACGHRLQCPTCSTWLVEHRGRQGGIRLECHHCGYAKPLPKACSNCQAEDSWTACGPGVERVIENLKEVFPKARIAEMSRDVIQTQDDLAALIQKMEARQIDILVGTQMVAKGHHFPYLSVVGVIDADLGLEGGDLRASERTFHLLAQVAGRAGRRDILGNVYIQSFSPQHPVIQALSHLDRDGFIAAEKAIRLRANYPPYARFVSLILSASDEAKLDRFCGEFSKAAPNLAGITILGPSPAPLRFLRGKHRRRFLLKAPKNVKVQPIIRDWIGRMQSPSWLRLQVDIDPISFL